MLVEEPVQNFMKKSIFCLESKGSEKGRDSRVCRVIAIHYGGWAGVPDLVLPGEYPHSTDAFGTDGDGVSYLLDSF